MPSATSIIRKTPSIRKNGPFLGRRDQFTSSGCCRIHCTPELIWQKAKSEPFRSSDQDERWLGGLAFGTAMLMADLRLHSGEKLLQSFALRSRRTVSRLGV